MGSWTGLGKRFDNWLFDQKHEYDSTVTFETDDGWDAAADSRMRPRSKTEIVAALNQKNSYRMWRLRHDFKWLQRQMKKMGYNPEDARELL